MMVYPIQGAALVAKYQGAGMAIAAAADGQLIDFHYLHDTLETDGLCEDEISEDMLSDPRLGPIVDRMKAQVEVLVGMCSCYEFVVL